MEERFMKKSSMSVPSLVLGILCIVFCWVGFIALPTSVLSIVFGAVSVSKSGSGVGRAGLIMGIVGLSLFSFMYTLLMMKFVF